MNEKDRIMLIMNQKQLLPSQFAEIIGIQRAAMSHITSGRNNPSLDVLKKILEQFPHISPDWLLFGTGPMNRPGSGPASVNEKQEAPNLFTHVSDVKTDVKKVPINPTERKLPEPVEVKSSLKDIYIPPQTPTKEIQRIMVFYSDNTYESFGPEKK